VLPTINPSLKRSIARCTGANRDASSDRLTLLSGKKALYLDYWLERFDDEISLTLNWANGETQTMRVTTAYPLVVNDSILTVLIVAVVVRSST
jgi:hypothetical protein